ncbi:MAG: F0F1 ATP synthase subunit delta [Hyphomicrobiaceae bacterium]|nr:F0F1 ATP synthase subunit delta [Hyphomicrobiaceae bacterium]
MQISWWTFSLQIVNFLVLVWLLERFLYKPVRDILERRKQMRVAAEQEVARAKEQAEAERRQYEEGRAGLTKERQAMLDEAHGTIEAERSKLMDEARTRAEKLISAAHVEIAEQRAEALVDMKTGAVRLAGKLAAKILESERAPPTGEAPLDRVMTALEGLSEVDRQRLQHEVEANGCRAKVTTARPIDSAARKTWETRLASATGQAIGLDFEVDPDILGGAALHFGHMLVSATWLDQLREGETALLSDDHGNSAR